MRTTYSVKIPNKQNDIEQFWAKVYINGELLDQKGDYALYAFAGKTYLVEKKNRGGISKITRDTWDMMKADIPEADAPEPMPSDDELDAMMAEMEAM